MSNLLAWNFSPIQTFGYQSFDRGRVVSDLPLPTSLPFGTDIGLTSGFDFFAIPVPQAGSSKIVFTSNRDGNAEIYSMNADGSSLTRLTTNDFNDDRPRWSPDGTKILFQSDRDSPVTGTADVYVMNANGTGQTRLTYDAADDSAAVWSPDGSKIVFQSLRNGQYYQVYVMNADGTNQLNLSNGIAADTHPAWSPNGLKIAFASERDQPGFPSVYVMNSNGTNQTRLTISGAGLRDEQPVWSPNGMKIAFTSTRDSTTNYWTETDDYEIPEDDGQTFPKSRLNINKEVYVMNPDGTAQARLSNSLGNDDSPTWSPDGSKIVFRSERERDLFDPTPQVWTMNADGSGETNLSNSGDGDFSPSWTSGSANQSPVSVPGGPYSGVVGQNAPFNGGGSNDPDGTIVSYAWAFGDGATGAGANPTHAYSTSGTYNVMLTVTDNLGAQGTASTTINISTSSSDQFVANFLQWGLGRGPNGEESAYWRDIMRAAYPQGQTSMMLAMREFGMTVFDSAEYSSRPSRDCSNSVNAHNYVYDLYKTYMLREPDQGGWDYWAGTCSLYGRDAVRKAFDESGEFANIVATLTASGSPSSNVSSLATAQVDSFNQTGNQLQARNAEWSANLLSLPGRAGLDLGLSVFYSSLVFTRSGPYLYFDQDYASLSPGFAIGFPTIQFRKFDAQAGRQVYILNAAGRRTALRQVGASNVYESADSSYLQLIDNGGSLLVRSTDGTHLSYQPFNDGWHCTQIKDRNGNYITVNYDWRGDIQNVTDTLGRVIKFVYDANNNPQCITQGWNGQPESTTCDQSQAHVWATFGWENLTMQPTLASVVSTYGGESIPVLKMVGFDDGTYTKFLYNGNGQVERVTQYASDSNPLTDNHPRSYTDFDYNSATNDCPRLDATRVWTENWTGFNGVPTEVTTQFGVEGDKHTVSVGGDPNGTVYKERYGSAGASPAWQRGLTLESEVWSGGVQQKLSTIAWTQDNPSVNYKTNPRVTQTIVSDGSNVRKTTIDYSVAAYAQFGLPYFVTEYAADGQTELRRIYRDYNLSQQYLDRRIIGLVSAMHLTDAGGYQSKITYGYDDPARLSGEANTATMHDQSYNPTLTVRGNATSISRWDVTDINNATKALTTYLNYNSPGSVISSTDPAGHANQVSYNDSFSDGNNARNTFAYPTTLTDADSFSSSVEYNFDFGAKTRVEGPPPANQSQGAIQIFAYDDAARIKRVTTANNGAYQRFVYGPDYVLAYSTVNNIADEAYAGSFFDGAGRVRATSSNHPGSVGGYSARHTTYDAMGRAVKQSNPTETNALWVPGGDDAAGWLYTQQTYDWQGRPLITTNTDGTTKEASYSGCGCAGGAVVTMTDEAGRRQKVYSDIFGRSAKTEVLNWDGSVYSATTNTYNQRDQVTFTKAYQGQATSDGACPSGICQQSAMTYDGYGRLETQHRPEQQVDPNNPESTDHTTWKYFKDDTIERVTDARGASATYAYNRRQLVIGITYNAPSNITPTAPTTIEHDAAGNRLLMTDGMGRTDYQYDALSQLESETRQFSGVGSYTLSYQHTLSESVKKITDPFGVVINYGYDNSGRLNGVTGIGGSVSSYATNMQYRAWGDLKGLTYGNGHTLAFNYNNRLQKSLFEIKSSAGATLMGTEYQYTSQAPNNLTNDGRVKYARDLNQGGKLDRFYKYDHVGRLSQGVTGAEARYMKDHGVENWNFIDGPYWQVYGYDAWDNYSYRSWRGWEPDPMAPGRYNPTREYYFASYANGRNTAWQYDAEGNSVSTSGVGEAFTYSYNSVGGLASATKATANRSVFYDGDGLKMKQVENGITTHYLRSSALDGAVVAELNGTGALLRSYVYADSEEPLVKQENNQARWYYRDPINSRIATADASGASALTGNVEFDPLGVMVDDDWARYSMGSQAAPPNYGREYFYERFFGRGRDPQMGCYLDGFERPCQFVVGLLNNEFALQCPPQGCTRYNSGAGAWETYGSEGWRALNPFAQRGNPPTLRKRGQTRQRRVGGVKRPRRTNGTPQGGEEKSSRNRSHDQFCRVSSSFGTTIVVHGVMLLTEKVGFIGR